MKNITIKSLLLCTLLTFSSCGIMVQGIAAGKISTEKGSMPPDFGKTKHVLLCKLKGKRGLDKYMKKHISNYYKGEVEFVTYQDLKENNKYSDKDKYRYVFESKEHSNSGNYINSNGMPSATSYISYSFGIFDRKALKNYSNDMSSGYFGKLIKAYAKKMEEERLGSSEK
ncbi:hypothetical protein EV195_10133 [Tenacibaculum skagerrakense]|uniref:Lipoprotein n=1 Tax=Tenacibaculum skagerrakense TaxID=186571 RepID=A0A4R2P1R1_9FLAO|nr:hypothetical protein [Tenacibaculum skagerrakense]TCP27874.1 hypothetical protein EV195_10133 [Tenacibaculum skagerrakense]